MRFKSTVLACPALVVVGTASAAAAGAPAGLRISAEPALAPAFAQGIGDYAVRCEAGRHVRISVAAPRGTDVSVDRANARSGTFSRVRPLLPGQQLRIRVSTATTSRTYHVRCVPDDFPKTTFRRSATPSDAFYLITRAPWAAMFDAQGVPVWWVRAGTPVVQDAELLPDGTIGWFRAKNTFLGSPDGFEVHRLDGSLVSTISARSDTPGEPSYTDIHDVVPLPNGDYLVTKYRRRAGTVDLTPCGGPSDATVVDGEVQRIRPGSAQPVWTWNSKDHVAMSESARWCAQSDLVPLPNGRRAYDLVHLNSLQLVGGSLIVSMRHTDAAYKIDYRTKRVVWKLGGTPTPVSLTLVGDSLAETSFGGPHFARQLPDGSVTLHDNGTERDRPPRAVRYRIDEAARTATLLENVVDPRVTKSICCGSSQRLANGGWLMSWGANPYITELTPSGKRVFTLTLGPREYSYRVFPIAKGRLERYKLRRGMDAMHPRG